MRLTLSIPEAGRILGLGRAASYEAARRGEIPTIALGRRRIVPARAIEEMLQLEPGTLSDQNFESDLEEGKA